MKNKPSQRAKELNSIIESRKKPYDYQITVKKIDDAIKRTNRRQSSNNKTK